MKIPRSIGRMLLAGAACAMLAGTALAQQMTKATVRLDWIPGAEHAFMYYGKEKGYFSDVGIDLDILPGQGSTISVKLVGNGDNDFAFADGTTLVRAWEAGVPLSVLHVLYQETPTTLIAKKSSGIAKPSDVCGRKVGVVIQSTTYVQFKSLLKAANVSCKYEEVPVTGGGLNDFMAGTVDMVHTYSYLIPVFAKLQGVEVVEFKAKEYFNLYSQTLITNKATLAKGDLAQRFHKASMKSLAESLKNPDEALAAFGRANKEANMAYEKAKFPVVSEFLTVAGPGGGGRTIGVQTMQGWTN
ncbi:MAG TPA: ABC transporter substrate-binding protein, partial [Burkholderiaceae bacterium]|nr:ABC transporter substrate-binding protein [Burkholderiaceae bacterium]